MNGSGWVACAVSVGLGMSSGLWIAWGTGSAGADEARELRELAAQQRTLSTTQTGLAGQQKDVDPLQAQAEQKRLAELAARLDQIAAQLSRRQLAMVVMGLVVAAIAWRLISHGESNYREKQETERTRLKAEADAKVHQPLAEAIKRLEVKVETLDSIAGRLSE